MMISQAMDASNPPQFALTENLPTKCTATDEVTSNEESYDASSYCSVEDGLHCDVLDVAEIVTVTSCVSLKDSVNSMCNIVRVTEIIPETDTCCDNCPCSSDVSVEETCPDGMPRETNIPCDHKEESGLEVLQIAVRDPCVVGTLSEDSESSYNSCSSSSVTDSAMNDGENCSSVCNTCCELRSLNDSQACYFSRKDFPFEVAHIMDVTTSRCEDDASPQTHGENLHEASGSLGFLAKSDSVAVPGSLIQPEEVEMVDDGDDHVSACCSNISGSYTDQIVVALVAESALEQPTLVLGSNKNVKFKEESNVALCLAGITNDSSTDSSWAETVASSASSLPLSFVELCEIERRLKDGNNAYLCEKGARIENDPVATDKTLMHSPQILESYSVEVKSREENDPLSCLGVSDAHNRLPAVVPGGVGEQPLSELQSREVEMKPGQEVSCDSYAKNEFDIGFTSDERVVEEVIVWPHVASKSHGEEMKPEEKLRSNSSSFGVEQTVIQLLSVLESHNSKVNSTDRAAYSCKIGIRNNIDSVVDNPTVQPPPLLKLHATDVKLEEKTEFSAQLINNTDVYNVDNRFNAIAPQFSLVLDSCELQMKQREATYDHSYFKDKIGFDSSLNTTVPVSENVLILPSSAVESCDVELEIKNNNQVAAHSAGITNHIEADNKLNVITSENAGKHSLSVVECEEKKKSKDNDAYSCLMNFRNEIVAVVTDDALVRPSPYEEPQEMELKLEGKDQVITHLADTTLVLNEDSREETNDSPSFLRSAEVEMRTARLGKVSASHTDIKNNFDADCTLNVLTLEASSSSSPVVKRAELQTKIKENTESLSPCRSIKKTPHASERFMFSVMNNCGALEEPDIELTKHLIQGLRFFTPVRDILRSHRLLSQSPLNCAESPEPSQFSGFSEAGCMESSKQYLAGMTVDRVVEERCGHFSVACANRNCLDLIEDVSLKKKCLRFGSITVYYFPRTQGFTTVSSDGGVALGMELRHCDVRLASLLDYAVEKDQRHHKNSCRKRKKKRLSGSCGVGYESNKAVQTLPSHKRTSLLRTAGIRNVDHEAIQEALMISASRLACGCFCTDGCLPSICFCARMEIECLIERDGFPCKCAEENCGNPHGRTKFSPSKVRSHFVHTLTRLKKEEVSVEEPETSPASQEGDRSRVCATFDCSAASFSSLSCGLAVEPCVHTDTFPTSLVGLTHQV